MASSMGTKRKRAPPQEAINTDKISSRKVRAAVSPKDAPVQRPALRRKTGTITSKAPLPLIQHISHGKVEGEGYDVGRDTCVHLMNPWNGTRLAQCHYMFGHFLWIAVTASSAIRICTHNQARPLTPVPPTYASSPGSNNPLPAVIFNGFVITTGRCRSLCFRGW